VAAALAFYCAGIVPQAAIEIHSRGFYALGDTRTPVGLAIVAMGFNLGLSALLWERFGLEGLAFAFAAAAWIEWASLYYLYLRRTGAAGAGDMDAFARIAFSGACMALFLALATWWYDRGDRADSAIVAIAGSLAGAAFYAGMASLLRLPELTSLWARLPRSPAREE
ncbi:MAG: polysaccharide biosynthesis C-terminal domain-containing protein, partial [Dehalococcoidia bacterium]|nr:polysaccharide biosynthesis C-terminal domain-containing protein [Dehalococcoidia bacterium]